MTAISKRSALAFFACVATLFMSAAPAHAGLLGKIVQTTTSTVGSTVSTVTSTATAAGTGSVTNTLTTATTGVQTTVGTAVGGVTTTVAPVTQPVVSTATAGTNTATSIIQPVTSAVGSVVADTTTATSTAVDTVLAPVLNTGTVQQLNVIPADYDPITPIGQLLGGTAGLGNVLQGVTCKPLTEVSGLLNESPIVSGLTSLACNAGILDYKFFTQFKKADGSMITRSFTAQLGVPTLLDVDEDATPDFIGTLTFTGLNAVGLTVERVSGEAADEPVSIEAVISDPQGGLLGRRQLAVGYDARDDRAPGRFVLSTPLDTILHPAPTVTASLAQTDRGEKIALLAGAFDGTPAARVDPAELRLHYDRSPDSATITANIGQAVSINTTTNRPGPAQITGRIVSGADQTRFNANITDLPSSLSLSANTGGNLSATYGASAPVSRIDGSFEQLHGTTLEQKAILDLRNVPTGLSLSQDDEGGQVHTTGGPLGLAKVGFANGEPQFLTDDAYAYLKSDASGFQSTAIQIPGIEDAVFSLGDVPRISATLQSTKFRVRAVDPQRTIDALVDKLPHQLDLTFDLAGGVVDYDGHGSGIDRITLAADQTSPFFGRATKVRGTIEGIPARTTVSFSADPSDGGVEVSPDPIGKIELLASNGPETLVPGAGQGAIYQDVTGGDYLISARVLQLRKIGFRTTPNLGLQAITAGGPFTLSAQTDTLKADGEILDLPQDTTLGLTTGGTTSVSFVGKNGNGDNVGIEHLNLRAESIGGTLFGRASRVEARIDGIPSPETLSLTQAGGGIAVEAASSIDKIRLAAASRAIDFDADQPAGANQAIHYVDNSAEFVASARVLGFKKVAANISDTFSVYAETQGGVLNADLATDDLAAQATVDALPAKTTISGNLGSGQVTFKGRNSDDSDAPINAVDVTAQSTNALFGRAKDFDIHVGDIPADLTVDFADNGEGVGVTADRAVGLVELGASSEAITDRAALLPAGNEMGVRYEDRAAQPFVIGARVRQFKKARVQTGMPIAISTETESGPFDVQFATDDLSAHARIEDLPSQLNASLNLDAGKLIVNNSAELNRVLVDATSTNALFGRATNVHADVRGIPAAFTVDFAQNGDGVGVSTDDPIQSIEVAAGNHAFDATTDLPANNEQGVIFKDNSGGDYVLGARVRKLKTARVSTGTPITIKTETEGGPFTLDVDTDDLQADGRIEDLPETLNASLNLDQGKLVVNNSAALARILVNAHSTSPLFGRAKYVHADIKGIPAAFTVDFAENGDGVGVSTDDPIDSIEVAAANRAIDLGTDLPPTGEQGINYTDVSGGDYAIGARVLKLKKARLVASTPLRLSVETAGGPFTLHANTDDLTGNAVIHDLPAKLDASIDLDAGKLTVNGRDADGNLQRIDSVHVDLQSATPVFGNATNIVANITDIPGDMDLDIAQDAAGVRLDAHDNPIGQLEIAASDHPIDLATALPAGMGATYHDNPGDFLLAARVNQLKLVNVSLSDNINLVLKTAGGPFDIDVDTADLDATGYLHDLPDSVDIGLDPDSGEVHYAGSAAIEDVYLAVASPEPFFANARRFSLAIKHLVKDVSINLAASGTGGGIVNNTPDPIESIQLLASSDPAPQPFPASIADGEQGAVYHDNAGDFLLAARLLDLRSLTFGLAGDSIGLNANLRSTPFSIDLDASGVNATARIEDLPAKTSLNFDLANGHFGYTGKDQDDTPVGLDSITFGAHAPASAPLFGAATKLAGKILNVPPTIDVGFDQDSGAATITTDGGAIGELSFLASNDDNADFRTNQGITFRDVTPSGGDREFNLSAKVLGLSHLTAGLQGLGGDDPETPEVESGSILLDAKTAGGRFDLDIASDAFSATGVIDQLPPVARVEANLGDGQVSFNGSAGIDQLQLSAFSNDALFGRADHLDVDIHGLPQSVTLGIAQSDDPAAAGGTGASLVATDADGNPVTITSVEVAAWNASSGKQVPAAGDQGVVYVDKDDDGDETNGNGGDFAIGARILQLQSLVADFGDALTLQTKTAGGPFRAHIDTAAFGGDVAILDLPSEFNLTANLADTAVEVSPGNSVDPGTISYSGNATIGQLTADVTSEEPLIGDANAFKINLEGLPAAAAIGVAPDSGKLSLNAGGGQISKVELFAKDAASSFPTVPGPATGDGAFLDDTDGHFRLAARIFDLQLVEVTLDPIALHTKVGSSRPFNADIKLAPAADAEPGTQPIHATMGIINLPAELTVGIADLPSTVPDPENPGQFLSGGSKLSLQSTANVSQVTINADGLELLPGAEGVGADLRGVPKTFSLTLPDTEVVTGQPLATLAVDPGQQIDELRLAAGGVHLTDAGMTSGGSTDQFIYHGDEANFGVGVKLTGVKGLSMNLDPINLAIDQNATTTKPINIDASLPQTDDNGNPIAPSVITGLLNKPTGHTEVGVTLPVDGATTPQPTTLNLRNGAVGTPVSPGNANQTMASLTLNLTNLGDIPSASFSLTKVPQILKACLATDGSCIRTDSAHSTTNLGTSNPSGNCTGSQTAGNFPTGMSPAAFRPYNPQTSLYFDDQNTSTFSDGVNSANNRNINNMITMNANIGLATGPVIINNMRFHNISLDFADSGTSFTFKPIVSISAGQVPRIYLYIDSQKYPFVLNDVRVPPSIPKLVMGNDSNPARAFKRIAWITGAVRGSVLGCGVSQNITTVAQNSLDCGGAKQLDISTSLGTLNAFNLPLFGDVLNICGGSVPTS